MLGLVVYAKVGRGLVAFEVQLNVLDPALLVPVLVAFEVQMNVLDPAVLVPALLSFDKKK
jgi:hypothetical protein